MREALPDDLDDRADRGSLVTGTGAAEDPAALAIAEERRQLVLEALATLPAEQRAALVLVDMEGYPVAEAAAMLDVAVGTVKSRCSRGRARLAELLGVLRSGGEPRHGNPPGIEPVPSSEPAGDGAARPTVSAHPDQTTQPVGPTRRPD
ncbi:MAG: sigma factor-like helix-turn-helix DNA-binding protein [Nocardioides sp.]